jgi:hypothetical protein
MTILYAILVSVIGVLPLIRKPKTAFLTGLASFLVTALVIYEACPSTAWPLFGLLGVLVVILWAAAAAISSMEGEFTWAGAALPMAGVVLFIVFGLTSCDVWRSNDYHGLIGQVEQREWTQDVQPKDPGHVRLVTAETAFYLANKQLGEAPGSVGSQFEVVPEQLTLQIVRGELWYVAPLDFKGYSSWTSTEGSPGYIMVHGEDPKRPVVIKTGLKMRYLLGAYFGDQIERFAWQKYGTKYVLTDFTFEADDEGNPFWTITACHPTAAWSGLKVDGVITISPITGESTFYELGKVPQWIDRVMPQGLVKGYVYYYTQFVHGWWNSCWGHKDVMETEEPEIAYGSDGEPYWVTGIATPAGSADQNKHSSLTGLMYTDARTGKSILYRVQGGTAEAVVDLVNNRVSYRKLHGCLAQCYNIYGVMTAIVPLLGESHSFQGVAFVDVANMQVAEGDDEESALLKYQQLLTTSGQQVAPEQRHNLQQLAARVSRFTAEIREGNTMYYLYFSNYPHIFAAGADISPKLRLTQTGDNVSIGFVDSQEAVVPVVTFDNSNLAVERTPAQTNLQGRVAARVAGERREVDAHDARAALQGMTDQQVIDLMKKAQKK